MKWKDGKELFMIGADAYIPVVVNVRVHLKIVCKDVDEFEQICYSCRGKKLSDLPKEVEAHKLTWEDDDWSFRTYIESRFRDVGEVQIAQDEITEILKQFENKNQNN